MVYLVEAAADASEHTCSGSAQSLQAGLDGRSNPSRAGAESAVGSVGVGSVGAVAGSASTADITQVPPYCTELSALPSPAAACLVGEVSAATGQLLRSFPSIAAAARALGLAPS